MAVRPFWIEAWIDGKKSNPLAGGPRSKDGAMTVQVFQRDRGSVRRTVQVSSMPGPDGTLRTVVSVWRNGGYVDVATVNTDY